MAKTRIEAAWMNVNITRNYGIADKSDFERQASILAQARRLLGQSCFDSGALEHGQGPEYIP